MAANDFVNGRMPLSAGGDLPYKNTSGSAITAGQLLKLDTGNLMSGTQGIWGLTPTTAVADFPFGVAVDNVPVGGTGRVQVVGVVLCIAAGAISAGAIVGPSTTAGNVTTYTAANPQFGQALSAAANAGDQIFVLIEKAKNA